MWVSGSSGPLVTVWRVHLFSLLWKWCSFVKPATCQCLLVCSVSAALSLCLFICTAYCDVLSFQFILSFSYSRPLLLPPWLHLHIPARHTISLNVCLCRRVNTNSCHSSLTVTTAWGCSALCPPAFLFMPLSTCFSSFQICCRYLF